MSGPPSISDIFPDIEYEKIKVFVIGADDCDSNREAEEIKWKKIVTEQRLRYFCDSKWPTKREIVFRALRIPKGRPKIVSTILSQLLRTLTQDTT